jgi:hypothetical protein
MATSHGLLGIGTHLRAPDMRIPSATLRSDSSNRELGLILASAEHVMAHGF